jgi:hypothetical protein
LLVYGKKSNINKTMNDINISQSPINRRQHHTISISMVISRYQTSIRLVVYTCNSLASLSQ